MATFNYNKVNLAAAQIPSAITASQTSITVDASESALFPTVPFFATIMPAGGVPNTLNSEIVQVTAVNTTSGALTITRAQRGTTAKAQDEGAVIMNGVYIEDLSQSQAVGKSFFSATLSSSVYYIQDARLTTTPENGDSIRVVFGSNWTSGTPKLSLNSGTSHNIYAGNNLTASHGTTTTPALVKTGIIYELTYYSGAWYILNLVGNSSITSDNVDWATIAPCWRGILSSTGATFATTRVNSRRVRIHVGFTIQNSSPSNIYLTSTNATGYCYWSLYGVRTDGFITLSGENNNQSCIALCSPEAVARRLLHLHITLDLINYNGDGISWFGQIVIASAGGANNINGKIEFTLSEANNFGTLGILPLTATITNAEWTLEEFLYN